MYRKCAVCAVSKNKNKYKTNFLLSVIFFWKLFFLISGRKLRSFVKNLGGDKNKSRGVFSKTEKLTRSPTPKIPKSLDSKEEPIYTNVSSSNTDLLLESPRKTEVTVLPVSTPEELYQSIGEAFQIKLTAKSYSSSSSISSFSPNTSEKDSIEIMADFDTSEFKDLIPKFNGRTEDLR